MITLLVILATVGCHRIWHYEDIFAPLRSSLGAKFLIDPTITPLWIGAILAGVVLVVMQVWKWYALQVTPALV